MFLITKENWLKVDKFSLTSLEQSCRPTRPLFNKCFLYLSQHCLHVRQLILFTTLWFTLLALGYLTKTFLCPDHTLVTIYCLVVATEAQQPINILLQDLHVVIQTLFLMSVNSFLLFSSGYDFAYLLKVLTAQNLPSEESEFFDLLKLYFPNIYDVKYLMKSCKSLKGGLQEVAELLEVRIQINKSFDEPRQLQILLIIV